MTITRADDPASATVHFDMPRRHRDRASSMISVNLTPAIDITFNLLIFFLVATTFKAVEGMLPSKVPVDQGVVSAVPLPLSPIKIRVRQIGEGPDDYSLSIDHWRRAPESFAELTRVLEALLERPGFDAATPVVIMPQGDVRWDHVVNCFNAIRRCNLHRGPEHTIKNINFAAGS